MCDNYHPKPEFIQRMADKMFILFAHNAGSSIHTRSWGTLIDVCLTVITCPSWKACTVVVGRQILLDRMTHVSMQRHWWSQKINT